MEVKDCIGTEPLRAVSLKVYPSGDSDYTWYDCDAESFGYEKGQIAATHISCSSSGKAIRLTVDPAQGHFEEMPASREWTFSVQLARKPSKVMLNGARVKDWTWTGGTLTVKAGSQPVSSQLSLTIQL